LKQGSEISRPCLVRRRTRLSKIKAIHFSAIIRENHIKEKVPLRDANSIPVVIDQGGRRSGIERRKICIPGCEPERRSGQDRRKCQERRNQYDPGAAGYLKRSMDRYMEYANTHKGMAYGLLLSLPIWAAVILFVILKFWP
jgi:hypothetical protein